MSIHASYKALRESDLCRKVTYAFFMLNAIGLLLSYFADFTGSETRLMSIAYHEQKYNTSFSVDVQDDAYFAEVRRCNEVGQECESMSWKKYCKNVVINDVYPTTCCSAFKDSTEGLVGFTVVIVLIVAHMVFLLALTCLEKCACVDPASGNVERNKNVLIFYIVGLSGVLMSGIYFWVLSIYKDCLFSTFAVQWNFIYNVYAPFDITSGIAYVLICISVLHAAVIGLEMHFQAAKVNATAYQEVQIANTAV